MSVTFNSINSDDIITLWAQVEPFVKMATDQSMGDLTPKLVLSKILTDSMQTLVVVDEGVIVGAAVTEIPILATGEKTLKVVCLGGKDFDDWGANFVDLLKNWASSMGINRVQLTGRQGWGRKLKKLGWKTTSINMEVEADG